MKEWIFRNLYTFRYRTPFLNDKLCSEVIFLWCQSNSQYMTISNRKSLTTSRKSGNIGSFRIDFVNWVYVRKKSVNKRRWMRVLLRIVRGCMCNNKMGGSGNNKTIVTSVCVILSNKQEYWNSNLTPLLSILFVLFRCCLLFFLLRFLLSSWFFMVLVAMWLFAPSVFVMLWSNTFEKIMGGCQSN